MMKHAIVFAGLMLTAAVPAFAEDRTPEQGAPFCEQMDDLKEYMTAMVKQDKAWMDQLKGCGVLKGGLKIGIIEDYPGSDLGHVQKVRVFGKSDSAVVYILHLDLGSK